MSTLAPLTRVAFFLSAVALPAALSAHPSKVSVIDDFCASIRKQFVEASPKYFAGPDPWLPLDKPLDGLGGPVIASVYSQGTRVRWLILEMQGSGNSWAQTTQYFFDESGLIKKRVRLLDQFAAHIQIHEEQYFQNRKIIKTAYHHLPLPESNSAGAGKENWDAFYDPDAPTYIATANLPAEFRRVEFRQLARNEILFRPGAT